MWVTSSLATALTPTILALGNFDGIHRGHVQVVRPVLDNLPAVIAASHGPSLLDHSDPRAPQEPQPHRPSHLDQIPQGSASRPLPATAIAYKTLVTFSPHPQEFFTGNQRSLLTPLDEKVMLLEAMGFEQLVLLPFNRELASLSPEQFVDQILIRQLQAQRISIGADFRFGHQRVGTADDLQAIAAAYNTPVTITPLHCLEGERISSSAIRHALDQGDMTLATKLLGRPYQLVGKVVAGQQLGRQLGFPTANLQLPSEKFLPRRGVYAVEVSILGQPTGQHCPMGVMNLGCRPTVDGSTQLAEVHLLDWSEDLYGQTLIVSLDAFLRPEQRFASLDDLKAQIKDDCATARAIWQVSN